MTCAYDIIGDIHGQDAKLEALLVKLGYTYHAGAWRHPTRKALFSGDYVDRGPGQLATLRIVRDMVEAGSAEAILGNHEFNAIAFHTPDPLDGGRHLRVRNDKNRRQHAGFIQEVGEDTPLHDSWIKWFMTLPLWIEKPQFRVVHACWHPDHMAQLKDHLGPNNTLTPALVEAASRPDHPCFHALETICKGLEIDLPEGVSFTDAEGTVRRRTRVKWWDRSAHSYRQAALLGKHEASQLPETPIPEQSRVHYDNTKPVFFGHYWFTGTPQVLAPRMCCVDYSAAREGLPLVAYRYDGEPDLDNDKLVFAHAEPRPASRPRSNPS